MVPGRSRSPSLASRAGRGPERPRICGRTDGVSAPTWSTTTTGAGKWGGSAPASFMSASTPPAEAPITTILSATALLRSKRYALRLESQANACKTDETRGGGQIVRPENHVLQEYARVTFPIVGVGASAGGIEAATALLQSLPEQPGFAVVIVQHQERKGAGGVPPVPALVTARPVIEARDGEGVRPNHVYISPPFADVTITGGVLHLGMPQTRAAMPIDLFFENLAEDQGSRAIGVILSGTASDGTLGAKAIKAEGGITFAQDESARFDGMPRAAIAAGSIDFVLPPDKIADELVRIAQHAYVSGGADGASGRLSTADLTKIFTLLNASHDVDFTHYKPATLERRVRRRMVVHRAETINEYLDYIRENPKELELLHSDMLIRVTGFFRDPEVFEMLKSEIIPELVARREANAPLRVWVPGCATGEEVYSLAIAFLEVTGDCPVQIFGTDISEAAIDRARSGVYPESAVTDVSAR